MNSRLLAVTVAIMVLISIGIGILIFRPTEAVGSQRIVSTQPVEEKENTINVNGNGNYKIKPDIAYVNIGVITENANAKQAQSQNKITMDAVVKAVKTLGLKDEDIQTNRYNISAQYDYSSQRPILKGYSVTNTVTLRINDIDNVGDVIDTAAASGANQAYDIKFGLKDPDSAYKIALENAIKDAKTKADVIAKATNIQLKGPVIISESSSQSAAPIDYGRTMMKSEAAMDVSTPISAGELTVNASVLVTYSIK